MPTKLAVGDIIQIHGWPMLAKLEDGEKYRVKSITDLYGKPTYTFAKPKGTKSVVRHYADSVDAWLQSEDHPNLNKIVKL